MTSSVIVRALLRLATAIAVVTALGAGAAQASAAGLGPAAAAGPASAGAAAPVPIGPELSAVSCPEPAFCLAVGSAAGPAVNPEVPAAGIWNGRNWRWTSQPPSPLLFGRFTAVSCLSASYCIATGAGSHELGFTDAWNGRSWRLLPTGGRRPPVGDASAISCVTTSFCLAVGRGLVVRGVAQPIAEVWDGTSWASLQPVIPAGTSIALDGVSCASTTDCMATGIAFGGLTEAAVAETWNGSSWTVTTPPSGLAELTGVSCPSSSECLAVGRALALQPASALWNGSTWSMLSTPSPDPFAVPGSISCPSVTSCIAVGGHSEGGFAWSWAGGTGLTLLSLPDQAGQFLPLVGVSCATTSSCLAVGGLVSRPPDAENAVLSWNGARWRVIRENKSDALAAVSCASTRACLAVGNYLDLADVTRPLAQSWSGKAWRLASPARITGFAGTASCVSRSFCMAPAFPTPLIWNGERWSATSVPEGGGVGGLSCVNSRFCMAASGSSFQVWHGKTWRELSLASPAGSKFAEALGVSCTSVSFCMAVGASTPDPDHVPPAAFIDVWNGTSWRLVRNSPRLGSFSALVAVSCVRGGGCMTVGNYTDARNHGHNVAVRWTGTSWRVLKMPGGFGFGPAPAGISSGPDSVSCSRAWSCVAVGSFVTSASAPQGSELAVVWNGKSWRLTSPGGPPSGLVSVSCTRPTFCMAAGKNANLALTERWNGHRWQVLSESNP